MPYQIHFISLGCAKNVVNCEQMMSLCRQAGYTLTEDPVGADVAVINTCGFLSSANEEAIDNILRMAELKKAEKAFMEEETKKLHEKFLKEKKELRAKFVAEREADYCMAAEAGTGV